ncbi:MAG TPA: AAC(3) family N-acetyltransferase [Streptosporangiaceae bacterium]|nr:AAC(3) family N-acetyltransferase [Streptosporangiaceae bacterium]
MTAASVLSETGHTTSSLAADLRRLGLQSGDVVLVHASMRQIGWVAGGAAAVAGVLSEVVGANGTLVVPTQTPDNSDTSAAHLARIAGLTPEQVYEFRAAMPPFDPAATPALGMGRLAEQIRTSHGAIRSHHPQTSFAALGPLACSLMSGHRTDCHLGEHSPLARLYDAGAKILLLGVGYAVCTAFHLAEYRYQAMPPRREYGCVVIGRSGPRWHRFTDVVLDDRDFARLGADLDGTGVPVAGRVGAADCRLLRLPSAVDFAVVWLRCHRVASHP